MASFDPEEGVAIKAKTLLSYYRGEISADEIKARGKQRDEKEHREAIEGVAEAPIEVTVEPEPVEEADPAAEPEATAEPEPAAEVEPAAAPEPVEETDPATDEEPIAEPEPEVTAEPLAEAVTELSTERIIAEAENEIIEQLEEEKEAAEKMAEEEREKNNVPLFAPKFTLSQDDLKDSKAKRVIVKNQIHIEDVCKNFFRVADVRHQIFNSLDLAVNERDKIYMCVTGEPGIGKTTLAARLVRLFFLAGVLKTDRLARADAKMLGNNGPRSLKNMLKKYNVLVENAGSLSDECIEALVAQAGDRKSGTCVVLEDNSRNINTIFRNSTALRELANNRIHLTKYDNNDLLGFAYDICRENEYLLAQSAADAILETLENKRMNESVRFAYVMEIMKKAVREADRRYAPGILKMAAEAAFSEDYSLVLTDEDIKP
ncbi:MAG: hypothetical protein MJ124_00025 [Lachnospiraceae bacterium]|nr:hypothetical protein [Lachnospiraceae bacterium]